MSTPLDAAQVDRIAAARLGATPQGQPGPDVSVSATPQNIQPPAPSPDKAADAAQAQAEAASDKATPNTEGDASQEAPISFKVKFADDDERELTPDQIKGTFERYKALNHKNAKMKPAIELMEKLTERMGGDPEKAAQLTAAALRQMANQQNPKATDRPNPEEPNPSQNNGDVSKRLEEWEQNFGELPPGYADMMRNQQGVTKAIQEMKQMFTTLMEQGRGTVEKARSLNDESQGREIDAAKQTLSTNLNAVQQKYGFSDEDLSAFQQFTAMRGYTMEDFIDRQLAETVAEDFKNAKNSGEFERLRGLNQRRQAALPSEGAVPGQGGEGGQMTPEQSQLDRMAQRGRDAILSGRRQ